MGYTSETLGAFSTALGEVYSIGSGSGNTHRPFPVSISKIWPKESADTGDYAYLVSLLHSHLIVPLPPGSDPGTSENKRMAEGFMQLRALALTLRECEVAFWIAEGKRDSEIAIILGVAVKTVGKHVEHLLEKLRVESRCAAAGIVIDLLNR